MTAQKTINETTRGLVSAMKFRMRVSVSASDVIGQTVQSSDRTRATVAAAPAPIANSSSTAR